MKTLRTLNSMMLTLLMLATIAASAQMRTTVKGVVLDEKGQPVVGANVDFVNKDNGAKFSMKTDKHGEYMSIAMLPGNYDVDVTKDKAPLFHHTNVQITIAGTKDGANIHDFKKSEDIAAPATSAKDAAAMKEHEEAVNENKKIENVNDIL